MDTPPQLFGRLDLNQQLQNAVPHPHLDILGLMPMGQIKNCFCIGKANPMLPEIGFGLFGVPSNIDGSIIHILYAYIKFFAFMI
ncbi:MAG: hypothetical protein PVH43_11570 [Desulfobacterales bacterium]|jgi:hypothetical protein